MKRKKILITGSSTGMGLEFSKKFISNGWDVLAHYYEETEKFHDFLENKNGIRKIYADFSDQGSVEELFKVLENEDYDALINNAGCFDFSKETANRIDAAKNIYLINTIVPILIAEISLKKFCQKNSGSIINISSIGVKFGSNLDSVFYGSSKIAIETVTRSLAREGAKHNVLVNTIRPGMTDTEFHKGMTKDLKARAELIPLKRFAHASEIAEVAYFLCEQNTFITGQIIPVSGGE